MPNVNKSHSSGIVTVAFGDNKYLEMALDLALSVRRVSSLPVSVMTNVSGARYLNVYADHFDRIIVDESLDPAGGNPFTLAKMSALKQTPYAVSMFLDSDMIALRDPSYLFGFLKAGGFTLMGRAYDHDSAGGLQHHGLSISDLLAASGQQNYVHCSLCCFVFSQASASRVHQAMESGIRRFQNLPLIAKRGLNDELLFGLAANDCGLDFFPINNPYQEQSPEFRWQDDYTFIHSAPMRYGELSKTIKRIVRTRWQYRVPITPALAWLSGLLKRRQEILGTGRRSSRLCERLANRVLRNSGAVDGAV